MSELLHINDIIDFKIYFLNSIIRDEFIKCSNKMKNKLLHNMFNIKLLYGGIEEFSENYHMLRLIGLNFKNALKVANSFMKG